MAISATLRRTVVERAGGCCEYCRIRQDDRLAGFEIDHIIAVKHGGKDVAQNLCHACGPCNRFKGANVAALDPISDQPTRLYNPRQQTWSDHFSVNADATLSGRTPEGRATIVVLRLNEAERVEQRLGEMLLGNYPCQNNPSS